MSNLAAYGIHRSAAFDSSAPSVRMLAEILAAVDQFFAESGCPLTEEQDALVAAVRRELARQEAAA